MLFRSQAQKELEAANQRMKIELEMAAGIQKSLLPANNQSFDGVEFCWQFRPCVELAGDTLNIIPLDKDRVAFYVIDVSGHGVSSALLSVTLHRWLSYKPGTYQVPALESGGSIRFETDSPAAVARQLNQQFPMTGETPQYFTMLYGVLDRRNGDFRYVSAGHPGPILVSEMGDAVRLQSEGFPIGLLPDADYHNEQMRLQPGDRLYIFSDGIPEAANAEGKEFGVERCRSSLSRGRKSSLQESLTGLMTDLSQWCQDTPFHDDITILGISFGVAP